MRINDYSGNYIIVIRKSTLKRQHIASVVLAIQTFEKYSLCTA